MTQAPIPANNKPENIQQNPAAMYQASVLYSPATLGYYWGWCSYYTPEEIPSMLREVGERTAEIALESFEVAIKAMGVHEPGPEERLAIYRVKPYELWLEQQAKFPWRFEHDMEDWTKLEQQYPATPEKQSLPEPPLMLPSPSPTP